MRLAIVTLALMCGCSETPTSVLLSLSADSAVGSPSALRIDVYDANALAVSTRRTSPAGATVIALPTSIVLYPPRAGLLRVRALAFRGDTVVGEGTSTVEARGGEQVSSALRIEAGRLPDRDGDDIPDAIDNCPDEPNPSQGPCSALDGPVDGPDASLDSTPDAPRDAALDTTPDLTPSDSTLDASPDAIDGQVPDAGPPIYVNETFGSTPSTLTARLGTWSYGGGRAIQSDTSVNGATLSAPIPVADYAIEAVIRITAIDNQASVAEGAGLAARIQAPMNGQQSKPSNMYTCAILEDTDKLAIGYATGVDALATTIKATSQPILLNVNYRLRMTIKGSQITCALPDLGVTINATDTRITSAGQAGVVTLYTAIGIDNLIVSGL